MFVSLEMLCWKSIIYSEFALVEVQAAITKEIEMRKFQQDRSLFLYVVLIDEICYTVIQEIKPWNGLMESYLQGLISL